MVLLSTEFQMELLNGVRGTRLHLSESICGTLRRYPRGWAAGAILLASFNGVAV